jgi:hypothetical protein
MKTILLVLSLVFGHLEGIQQKPENLSESIWNEAEPYLLPETHPMKKQLDRLFSTPDCIQDGLEFYKLGFQFPPQDNPLRVTVARHPSLKGYVIKVFLDTHPSKQEWKHFIKRIQGADLIRQTIDEKQYQASFKVPRKWLYFIPGKAETLTGHLFLLIAEDMKLVDFDENYNIWKNQVTYEQVYMTWDLIESLGLFDSVYIDNIPFSKDRRIAFIDTEHYLRWPVNYEKFNKYLSGGKKQLWKKLTGQDYKQSKEKPESKNWSK